VCRDAGGQALSWDAEMRRPKLDEDGCLSCMICNFICPVEDLITYKEKPEGWARSHTPVKDPAFMKQVKVTPAAKA
jgi:dihydropyrimidine dehydrogenase (NAD+) subunit PreA